MSTRRAAIRSAAITTVGLLFGSAEGIADSICNSHYRFEDIGALAVEKMNDHGDVVGYTFDLSLFIPRAFLKERDGSVRPLGDLGGAEGSIAWDINNSRKVVGTASAKSGAFHAFLWDPKHPVMRDLGTLGGPEATSVAMGINEWGQIVGSSSNPDEDSRAFLWSPVTRTMRDLGVLDEANPSASASAINNLGQVVGSSFSHGGEHAFLWSPRDLAMRDLGTLDSDHSFAEAINDLGQVAGYSSTQGPETHAFIWSRGRMQDIDTLGGDNSYAHAINIWGQIVGSSQVPPASGQQVEADHAFLWSQFCGMQDLNDLVVDRGGIVFRNASDINNRREIVAEADLGQQTHTYLLRLTD